MSDATTNSQNLEVLKYPIGKFEKPTTLTRGLLQSNIKDIADFPNQISSEVVNLSLEQLSTPYRPGGWKVRQVVHHCADSHMNAYIRFKLALTEDAPTIKPYFEDRWAELSDADNFPVYASLQIIHGLHQRWVKMLNVLTEKELEKSYIHPEHGRKISLNEAIGSYAWHCNHHLAHITSLKKRNNWN